MTAWELTRRRFLQGAAAAGAVATLGGCSGGTTAAPSTTTSPATTGPAEAPSAPRDGTLVIVTLTGGNDALNTVVPVADPAYEGLRGSLAVDQAATHDIGEGFALHPALRGCKALWDEQRLAVVHGVGFAGLDRSHFHCMDVWQAGSLDATATGWIGRWLDVAGTGPLDAVVVGRRAPLLARGATRSASVIPPGPLALPGDPALHELLATMAAPDRARTPLEALAAGATSDLLVVAEEAAPVLAELPADESLAGQLDTVAAGIDAGWPTRVWAVELGGFDTHAAQAPTHDALLAELDAALAGFLRRVARHPVTVLVHSEFGRRVAPNGSGGTDHGGAGVVLLAGAVAAGHHGEPPPLERLVDGDLATTIDFRSVYAGLLEEVLGTTPTDVLDRPPAPLAVT